MSNATWNFPCHQSRDKGPGLARATAGGGFGVGGQALPFATEMTGIFSFLAESGKTADAGELQSITSIGYQSAASGFGNLDILLNMTAGDASVLSFFFHDNSIPTLRYHWQVADETGSWLQFDKWYQVAFSANASRLQVVVNGSQTPYFNKVTDAPGTLNLNQGTERWWHLSTVSAYGQGTPYFSVVRWPSIVAGPSAWDRNALDLTDQTVLDRIFDSDGNFNYAGDDGSLWFGDTYTGTIPDVYLPNGGAKFAAGSAGLTWAHITGQGWQDCPGSLRKCYE